MDYDVKQAHGLPFCVNVQLFEQANTFVAIRAFCGTRGGKNNIFYKKNNKSVEQTNVQRFFSYHGCGILLVLVFCRTYNNFVQGNYKCKNNRQENG